MATRHVVLVGPMGVGKTTVGRRLAAALDWPLRDSDAELASTEARTAADIYRDEGTAAVHTREAAVLRKLLAADGPSVIAAAASVVEDPMAVDALADPTVLVVWLRGTPETVVHRATRSDHRPWHGRAPIDHLRERAVVRDPVYGRLARVVIDTERTPPDAAADAIVNAVRAQSGSGA